MYSAPEKRVKYFSCICMCTPLTPPMMLPVKTHNNRLSRDAVYRTAENASSSCAASLRKSATSTKYIKHLHMANVVVPGVYIACIATPCEIFIAGFYF